MVRQPLALALALWMLLPACAYESAYVAPVDGRARPVWKGSDVVVDLAGAPVSDVCFEQLRAWSSSGRVRLITGDVKRDTPPPARFTPSPVVLFWVPVYYGPPIVPGVVPLLRPPVLFSPSLALASAAFKPTGSSGSIGGGGGGSSDFGKALVILAVIALVVLPIVDLAVAVTPPESERSSDAIDQVNVFNDLARWPGSPCAYGGAP
jgi:hypothetical protein